jgi:hypothetical protein
VGLRPWGFDSLLGHHAGPPLFFQSSESNVRDVMLKLIIIVAVLLWVAYRIAQLLPRIEISIDRGHDEIRVFAIMREHFPDQYERYKHGLLSETEERQLYLDCVEILGARQEIDRL